MKNNAPASAECVRCTFSWLKYSSPDKTFMVCDYRNNEGKLFTAVGANLPVTPKVKYDLFGSWTVSGKTGKKQFNSEYFEVVRTFDRECFTAYLSSLQCGVGKAIAGRILDRFGEDAWDVIDNHPERLSEVKGIGSTTVMKIRKAVRQSVQQKELLSLFSSANVKVTPHVISELILRYGKNAAETFRNDPYCACGVIEGITFEKADAVAGWLDFPANDPNRLKAYIFKLLGDASLQGHVCVPADRLITGMANYLECSEKECRTALNHAYQEGLIRATNSMVYTRSNYDEETGIAECMSRLMKTGPDSITAISPLIEEYENEYKISLADNQREAVEKVFLSPVSIITGGPGTGKTTVIKAVLKVHGKVYGDLSDPLLLAPTGRAARRMTEATGYSAATVHSSVGYRGEECGVDPEVRIDNNLIIIDECSMLDMFITSVLLNKISSGARVVFVGDPDQLPSVGCGNVLNDMIRSGAVPTTRLAVIYRQGQDSPIIANAHAVNTGSCELILDKTFQFREYRSETELFNRCVSIYCSCVDKFGIDNVVLLNPQRRNTKLSVDDLNTAIQERINPHRDGEREMRVGNTTFRIGEKVMQLKNTENAKNGDIGYIRDIRTRPSEDDPDRWICEADIEFNGDGTTVAYNTDDMRSVELGYCTTVHKSQGSEYEVVIMIVTHDHHATLKRNLIYTAITRAKKYVLIAGQKETLDESIRRDIKDTRNTLLCQRLRSSCA